MVASSIPALSKISAYCLNVKIELINESMLKPKYYAHMLTFKGPITLSLVLLKKSFKTY